MRYNGIAKEDFTMKDEFVARVGVWGCGCPVDTSAEGRSTDRADRRDRGDFFVKVPPTGRLKLLL